LYCYLATRPEAVYVLHCFQKKSPNEPLQLPAQTTAPFLQEFGAVVPARPRSRRKRRRKSIRTLRALFPQPVKGFSPKLSGFLAKVWCWPLMRFVGYDCADSGAFTARFDTPEPVFLVVFFLLRRKASWRSCLLHPGIMMIRETDMQGCGIIWRYECQQDVRDAG